MPKRFLVRTQRLRIRPWRSGDRDALARMAGDPDMMRFLTDARPWSDAEMDEFLKRQARHVARHGVCMGPVEWIQTGEVVGLAGLQPLDNGEFELGWWIWKAYWNRGLATEAGRALIAHARAAMGLHRLAAVIDEANWASRRVAEKLGMQFTGIQSARDTNALRPDLPIALYLLEL